MTHHAKSRGGFTLFELVVSIAILALMAVMISRIFSESTRAIQQGNDQAMLDETARLLLDYLEQDISQSLIRTNVAFRVHPMNGNDALYFISTGMRRQLETIRRDTAPMRIQVMEGLEHPDWIKYLAIQSPYGAAEDFEELAGHSDYYFPSNLPVADFMSTHDPLQQMQLHGSPPEYTQPLGQGLGNHAVLTFLDIKVNGTDNSNYVAAEDGTSPPPEIADMPRFVDVAIGLVAANELETAMRLNDPSHIANREQIYTRRIFMRNRGVVDLNL